MPSLRRSGFLAPALTLVALLAACAAPPPTSTPEPTATLTVPPTLASLPTLAPSRTPAQPTVLTAQEEITLRAGPRTVYHEVGVMPEGHEATVIGRDQSGNWAQVHYGTLVGWVGVETSAVEISGDLRALPIVPVAPITDTPPPPAATFTPYPTFTPRPSVTPRATVAFGPTPEDRDRRTAPIHDFGVLGPTFEVAGDGALALPEDEFDYIGFQFDPAMSGQPALELEFTCDNPDAELLLTLFSTQRRDAELGQLYPVCNQGPQVFRALEPGNRYQIRIWLREADQPFLEATPESGAVEPERLETHYQFTLRNPRPLP
mgnify:CR=1 FL=1